MTATVSRTLKGLIEGKTQALESLNRESSVAPLLIDLGLFVGGMLSSLMSGPFGGLVAAGSALSLCRNAMTVANRNRDKERLRMEIARLRLELRYLSSP